jgi:hypothetical protein
VREDERLLAGELAAREEAGRLRREVHDRDEKAFLPEPAGAVEEEELPRAELAKEDAEAVEPAVGVLAFDGRENEDRDAGPAGTGGQAFDDALRAGRHDLVTDTFRLEPSAEARRVSRRVGGLEEAEDDGGEELERREEAEILDDAARRVRHDVRVDGDRRELLPRAGPEEVDVEARLRRAAGALEEAEDGLLRGELGAARGLGRLGAHGAARIRRFGCAAADPEEEACRRLPALRTGTSRRRR